jgi:hypothetical protein
VVNGLSLLMSVSSTGQGSSNALMRGPNLCLDGSVVGLHAIRNRLETFSIFGRQQF